MKERFSVLIVDDSPDDRLLLEMAMRRAERLKLIGHVTNGREAIAYLQGHAPFRDREAFPLPDLLLLDLSMPHVDGFGVLEWLGSQPFDQLTVVVLTDSMNPEHIKRALDMGADLFQVKPTAKHDRESMVIALEHLLMSRHSATPRHPASQHKESSI